jgi:hypothetical protein
MNAHLSTENSGKIKNVFSIDSMETQKAIVVVSEFHSFLFFLFDLATFVVPNLGSTSAFFYYENRREKGLQRMTYSQN